MDKNGIYYKSLMLILTILTKSAAWRTYIRFVQMTLFLARLLIGYTDLWKDLCLKTYPLANLKLDQSTSWKELFFVCAPEYIYVAGSNFDLYSLWNIRRKDVLRKPQVELEANDLKPKSRGGKGKLNWHIIYQIRNDQDQIVSAWYTQLLFLSWFHSITRLLSPLFSYSTKNLIWKNSSRGN